MARNLIDSIYVGDTIRNSETGETISFEQAVQRVVEKAFMKKMKHSRTSISREGASGDNVDREANAVEGENNSNHFSLCGPHRGTPARRREAEQDEGEDHSKRRRV